MRIVVLYLVSESWPREPLSETRYRSYRQPHRLSEHTWHLTIHAHFLRVLVLLVFVSNKLGPFFESCVVRVRFVDRTEDMRIPYEYKLCVNHFTSDRDMFRAMFRPAPIQARSASPKTVINQIAPYTPHPDIGVLDDMDAKNIPLDSIILNQPSIPPIRRCENSKFVEDQGNGFVSGYIKRAGRKIARSKSLSFLRSV